MAGVTGLNPTFGLDDCGVCDGNNSCVGCDGLKNSDKKQDKCGQCLNPTSEKWNSKLSNPLEMFPC